MGDPGVPRGPYTLAVSSAPWTPSGAKSLHTLHACDCLSHPYFTVDEAEIKGSLVACPKIDKNKQSQLCVIDAYVSPQHTLTCAYTRSLSCTHTYSRVYAHIHDSFELQRHTPIQNGKLGASLSWDLTSLNHSVSLLTSWI